MTQPDNNIYTVTVIEWSDWNNIRKRCWGWYSTFELANETVEKNYTDIHERIYAYAVIEKIPEGVCTNYGEKEYWYKWEGDSERGNYKPCPKPEWAKGTIGWGMG